MGASLDRVNAVADPGAQASHPHRREALADASPETSFALGALPHRSIGENVNNLRLDDLAGSIVLRRDVTLRGRSSPCKKGPTLRLARGGVDFE